MGEFWRKRVWKVGDSSVTRIVASQVYTHIPVGNSDKTENIKFGEVAVCKIEKKYH